MSGFALLGCVAIVAFVYGATRPIFQRGSRGREDVVVEPKSLVRVLRDDDELNDVIERTIEFERSVARAAELRAERYAQARRIAPVVRLPVRAESTVAESHSKEHLAEVHETA